MKQKKIALLGSTGSIGTQALDIIDKNRDRYAVSVLSCASNFSLLSDQIERFSPVAAVVPDKGTAAMLRRAHPSTTFLIGMEGLVAAASEIDCGLVLNALVGMIGLQPTCAALRAGRDVALANKETLVTGGELVMKTAAAGGARLIPVDSEHSAIFQCLAGADRQTVHRLILTASGGPFRGRRLDELTDVTVSEALQHPKWKMGHKITIDSATLMNKGLEVIEAHWLFDMPVDKISVVLHPQSIIHSMVEFNDHSILAQMGVPDMRLPIGYAFAYPQRVSNDSESLDFRTCGPLTFEEPDLGTFRCLQLAYDALKAGGSFPAALNAANEELVSLFLQGRIRFLEIQENIDMILQEHKPSYDLDEETIIDIDKRVRERVRQRCC